MKATITSKGQITIPQRIRERLNLKAGDVLEFDEDASVPSAHRVMEPAEWERRVEEVRSAWSPSPDLVPLSSAELLTAMRGPVQLPQDDEDRH